MKNLPCGTRGAQGYTLVEILVVVAILGVLAAVAIPNIASLMNKGETEAAATELSIVQTAVTTYMADHDGDPPNNMHQLVTAGYLLKDPHGNYTIDHKTGQVTQVHY